MNHNLTAQELAAKMADAILTADQVLKMPIPEWLVDGILPADGLGVLYGRPGVKKSFLALDMALCVATGSVFMADHEVRQGRVLYIAAEGRSGMSVRLEAWQVRFNVPEVPDFYLYPQAIPLTDERYGPATVELARNLQPRLIVVDTLARSMGGADENSTRDMSKLMDTIDQVRQATGAMVLLVHHTTKSGEQYRGNSSLEGAMDAMLRMSEEEGTEMLTLTCSKMKEGAAFFPLHMTYEEVTVRDGATTSCVLHPQDRMRIKANQVTRDLQAASFILNSPHGEEFTAKQIADATGIEGNNIHRTLKALVEQDIITARKAGRGNVYTMTKTQRSAFILRHPQLSSDPGSTHPQILTPRGPVRDPGEDEEARKTTKPEDEDPGSTLECGQ